MASSKTVYKSVISITTEYLGPAADRFINRQIRNHLQIVPEQLRKDELKDLIDWIKLAMNSLTNDSELVGDYINSLVALTKHTKTEGAHGSRLNRSN